MHPHLMLDIVRAWSDELARAAERSRHLREARSKSVRRPSGRAADGEV